MQERALARRQREAVAQLTLSAALLALGVFVLFVAQAMPAVGGFSGVGPAAMPTLVGIGLVLVGLWLLGESLTGGWRAADSHPTERGEHAFHAAGFVWVSLGLIAQMLLIQHGGFVIAAIALFVGVARGFGSRRPLRDALVGGALAVAIFWFFVRMLNVGLPAGWLQPLLGTAGLR